MESLEVTLSLPRDLIGALDVPPASLPGLVKESFAIEMFRQNRISSGKAAEMLSMSKLDFVQLLGKHSVPYFTHEPSELEAELLRVRKLMSKSA
jgi:hypothetical protein